MLDERQQNLENGHPQKPQRSQGIAYMRDLGYFDSVLVSDGPSSPEPHVALGRSIRKQETASPPLQIQLTPKLTEINQAPPIEIFTAYVNEDISFFKQIKQLYNTLKRQKYHVSCHESEVTENFSWQQKNYLKTAQMIILLVSRPLLDTDFCYHQHLIDAVARSSDGKCYVIPILVRSTSAELLQRTPFNGLEFLPGRNNAFSDEAQQDQAFAQITKYILEKLNDLELHS